MECDVEHGADDHGQLTHARDHPGFEVKLSSHRTNDDR